MLVMNYVDELLNVRYPDIRISSTDSNLGALMTTRLAVVDHVFPM